MCIYDNHQWECSSWIGCGIGMPNSIMSRYYERQTCKENDKLDKKYYEKKRDFWNRWWSRDVKTVDDKDGWDAQLNYLGDVIEFLNNRKSTFGFEILNEPEVFDFSHYKKIRSFNNFMINALRNITHKPLLFCWVLPHVSFDNPILQAMTSPDSHDDRIIYDGHSYPPTFIRMIYFRLISILMARKKDLVYMGEFSSGYKTGTTLTQSQVLDYVKRLKKFRTCGWAMWRWSYIHDQSIPAFNLAEVVNYQIKPGINFIYLVNALKEIR